MIIRTIGPLLLMLFVALMPFASVSAQTGGKVYRLGWVSFLPAPAQLSPLPPTYEVIKARLAERGYVEGKNLAFEPRWADGSFERVPTLLADLERSGVDVIYAPGSQMARISQNHVKRTPLVVYTCDPFEHVSSLARQGEARGAPGPAAGCQWPAEPV
jgi:putative ABC transport system substrate-binding protein